MKVILAALLYKIARQYFDKDLFDRVELLVTQLMNDKIPGDEKREIVRAAVKAEWVDISHIIVDTIIQIVLLKNLPL